MLDSGSVSKAFPNSASLHFLLSNVCSAVRSSFTSASTAACGVSSTSALATSFPCFLASFFIFLSLALFSALVSFTIPSSALASSAVPSSLRSFSDTAFEAVR
ncbi:hypothetical protein V8G54_023495 [Vigna mungo]|uniref:Transmembrane protein n=1 Tax=Vigna mungo TaxID=3915 RepID=A0AAQ3RSA0_VIGMU